MNRIVRNSFLLLFSALLTAAVCSCGEETKQPEQGSAPAIQPVPESEVFAASMERQGEVAMITGNALIFYYPTEAELAQREATEPDVRQRFAAHEALFNSLKPELSKIIPMYMTDAGQIKISISAGQVRLIARQNIPESFGMILYANGKESKVVRQDLTADAVRIKLNAYLGR